MNTHNPYTPPNAPVSDAAPPAVVVRKPVSVWLLQVVCGLVVLVFLFGLPTSIGRLAASPEGIARVALLTSLFFQLVAASLFTLTLIAAQRRSMIGRWLGVFLSGIMIAIVMNSFVRSTPDFEESFKSLSARFVGAALLMGPLALPAYFSAFSKRARAWYAG